LAPRKKFFLSASVINKQVFGTDGHAGNSKRANLKSSSVSGILSINSPFKAKKEALKVN